MVRMMKLSEAEIAALRVKHKLLKDRRMADRIKAVLMRSRGCDWQEIAECLLLDDSTIREYVKKYEESGLDVLLEWKYQGRQKKLTKEQVEELDQHIEHHCYQRAEEIVLYIEETYGVRYTVDGVTKLLKSLGFSYKQFSTVPSKADSEAQEEFIQKYEEMKKNKKDDEVIVFSDAVHPNLQTEVGKGWIKKGEKKEIPSASGRQRLNILGAINLEEKTSPLIKMYDTINADSVIDFIEALENKYPDASSINYICDNARYFYSKKVREKLESSRVEFHYLPSYSPNLNPIETFWKFFKQYCIKNRYFPSIKDFKKACLEFFDNLPTYAQKLDSFVSDNFRTIDASIATTPFE